MSILKLLDEKIQRYYQNKEDYPAEIIMSKETRDKLFAEINLSEIKNNNSWYDKKDNYRGIKIKIKKGILFDLK
jgi:hypothetical protein